MSSFHSGEFRNSANQPHRRTWIIIFFTGLTGAVGTEIVNLLPDYGIKARGLVRDPAKVDAIRAAGVEVISGSLEDRAAVEQALQGCERAFLLMANSREQLALEKDFTDAAREAGVGHLVKMITAVQELYFYSTGSIQNPQPGRM